MLDGVEFERKIVAIKVDGERLWLEPRWGQLLFDLNNKAKVHRDEIHTQSRLAHVRISELRRLLREINSKLYINTLPGGFYELKRRP